jgi:hypothetical protein
MAVYGTIKNETKSQFGRAFAAHFSLNPAGSDWISLAEALGYVSDHEEFRHSFGWSQMVLMLRKMCENAGLTREDRGEPPHVLEGYYGLERKKGY